MIPSRSASSYREQTQEATIFVLRYFRPATRHPFEYDLRSRRFERDCIPPRYYIDSFGAKKFTRSTFLRALNRLALKKRINLIQKWKNTIIPFDRIVEFSLIVERKVLSSFVRVQI